MVHSATLFVALAALFWGISGGVGGILLSGHWDAPVVSFYRATIGLAFVLIWLMIRPQSSGLTNIRLWFWSVIAGLGVAGNFTFYFLSISKGSVALAATLMYCAPVFVYLVSFALKFERPTLLKAATIVLVIFGIVLLTGLNDTGANDITAIGLIFGLLAGGAYAVFIFGFKNAAQHGSPQAILSIAFLIPLLILVWPSDKEQIFAALTSADWPLFIVLGVLGAGLSFVFYIMGLKHTSPVVASIVAMVEPVTASVFGVIVLHERLLGAQILGMVLILMTVTTLNVCLGSDRSTSG